MKPIEEQSPAEILTTQSITAPRRPELVTQRQGIPVHSFLSPFHFAQAALRRPPCHSALRRSYAHLQRNWLLSIWGNPASCSPFTTDANGPSSMEQLLFEDNAEHGMGLMFITRHSRSDLLEPCSAACRGGWRISGSQGCCYMDYPA